jgi:integrase
MRSTTTVSIHRRARQYLAHRRACGYQLQVEGQLLDDFSRFADRVAPGKPLSAAIILQWANRPAHLRPVTRANRLDAVRPFARFCRVFDSRTEIPPTAWSRISRRTAPYILTPAQIRLIIERTDTLRAWHSTLRPLTYRTLIGLLACTGLRISEALRLRYKDIDMDAGTLHISRAKFSPERDLPVHPTTLRALQHYRKVRQQHFPGGEHLFANGLGRPLTRDTAFRTWRSLMKGFPPRGTHRRPRYHDLRHSFATRLIAKWSRAKEPLPHRLVLLSRYLGHKQFKDTYWYIEPQRSALEAASRRFERFRGQPTQEDLHS